MKQIDKLIINPPYEEPKYYWHYDRKHRSFEKREGRRLAGYVVATPDSRGFDDPGVFCTLNWSIKSALV
jgi:type III restriction enzyme